MTQTWSSEYPTQIMNASDEQRLRDTMSTGHKNISSSLTTLCRHARELSFVVLIHRLERLLDTQIGEIGGAFDERVHLCHDPTLIFHSADVHSVVREVSTAKPTCINVTTSFAGITGAASPLPARWIESMAHDDDAAFQRDFLDIFHHRLLGLFYRGLCKYDLPRAAARETCAALDWVLLLCGLVPHTSIATTELDETMLLRLAPLLVACPPNAERLKIALKSELGQILDGAEIQVAEMQGGYVELTSSSCPRLGKNVRLGRSSRLGNRMRSAAASLRVSVHGLTPEACAQLGPCGDAHTTFRALLSLFVPETLQTFITLHQTHAPPIGLGTREGRLGQAMRLRGTGSPQPIRFTVHPENRSELNIQKRNKIK